MSGDSVQAVKAYLDAGGSPGVLVSVLTPDGVIHMPLLHSMVFLAEHPHRELAECVRLLVAAGADINATANYDGDERTALMYACERSCCIKALQSFLQNGADVIVRSPSDGMTALHQAATAGCTASCKLLVAKEISLVHVRDSEGRTALVCAVAFGPLEAIKMLLQHGADINSRDTLNRTPLMAVCALNRRIDVAAF
jgi:ankyrin repeat protein